MTEGVLVEDYVRYQWHDHEDLNPTGQPFPDPDRTIMTYDRDFGSGKGTLEAFMAEANAQERDYWRRQYTARSTRRILSTGIRPLARKTNVNQQRLRSRRQGGDQVRWDNWRNWSTGDWPIDGDAVRLDGHEVYYQRNARSENT